MWNISQGHFNFMIDQTLINSYHCLILHHGFALQVQKTEKSCKCLCVFPPKLRISVLSLYSCEIFYAIHYLIVNCPCYQRKIKCKIVFLHNKVQAYSV